MAQSQNLLLVVIHNEITLEESLIQARPLQKNTAVFAVLHSSEVAAPAQLFPAADCCLRAEAQVAKTADGK